MLRQDRVRSALATAHFEFPAGRITVNLAPADLPKEGGRFDLPIALGILAASAFNRSLDRRLDAAAVSPAIRAALAPERAKGGALKPPAGASETESRAITSATRASVDAAFRVVALGSGVLALLASGCAAWGVRRVKSL